MPAYVAPIVPRPPRWSRFFIGFAEQVNLVNKGATIIVRNSRVEMFEKKNMRLAVDKWGLIETSPQPLNEEVNWKNNVSLMDYELVQAD